MKEHVLLVYGTLRRGHYNHYLLRNATFLGQFQTPAQYTLYDLGGFPAVAPDGSTSVQCEAYRVGDDTYQGILALEGCTGIKGHPSNWYDIEDVATPWGKAVMFIMHNPKGLIIKSGNYNGKEESTETETKAFTKS